MSLSLSPLNRKVVWLTGASSGIGEALAFELAERGAYVALSARRQEILEGIAREIVSRGGKAAVFPLDVENLEAVKESAVRIESAFGEINCLIANAGTHIFSKPEHFDSKEYLRLMNINYGGMLHSIEAVLPKMIERKNGQIVGMCSLAGYRGLPRAAAYGASKAAMIHFLESIRFHLKPLGLKISIVNPGFVKTPLTDKNDFYMPFLIDAAKAAKIICDGIECEKREISFPFPFNWILKFVRLLPDTIYEKVINRLW